MNKRHKMRERKRREKNKQKQKMMKSKIITREGRDKEVEKTKKIEELKMK